MNFIETNGKQRPRTAEVQAKEIPLKYNGIHRIIVVNKASFSEREIHIFLLILPILVSLLFTAKHHSQLIKIREKKAVLFTRVILAVITPPHN